MADRRGSDPICAGVTVLVRTALRSILSLNADTVKDFRADSPGNFSFELGTVPDWMAERLSGITVFLMQGLSDLAEEHPQHVRLFTYNE